MKIFERALLPIIFHQEKEQVGEWKKLKELSRQESLAWHRQVVSPTSVGEGRATSNEGERPALPHHFFGSRKFFAIDLKVTGHL